MVVVIHEEEGRFVDVRVRAGWSGARAPTTYLWRINTMHSSHSVREESFTNLDEV